MSDIKVGDYVVRYPNREKAGFWPEFVKLHNKDKYLVTRVSHNCIQLEGWCNKKDKLPFVGYNFKVVDVN